MNVLSISLSLLALAGSPQDRVLYVPGWHRCARGEDAPFANCRVSFVSPETVASAPVAGLWAKVGLFRSLAAHYAPFYLEHFRQLSDERRCQ